MSKFSPTDIVFIINPNSGSKNTRQISFRIKQLKPDCDVFITNSMMEFDHLMESKLSEYSVFVVAGGDGTVNQAARFFAKKRKGILAIYPTGSGNGFARELGFKKKLDELFEDIERGDIIHTDLLSVNGDICTNVAGVGFDAHIAHAFQDGKTRGLFSYIIHILNSVLTFKRFEAKIVYNSRKINGKYTLISIANTAQYGNNARIAPQAKPNDKLIDAALVKHIPFWKLPGFVFRLMTSRLKPNKQIEFIQTNSDIKIITNYPKLHIDGDPKPCDGTLNISLYDWKLKLIKTRYNKL